MFAVALQVLEGALRSKWATSLSHVRARLLGVWLPVVGPTSFVAGNVPKPEMALYSEAVSTRTRLIVSNRAPP